MGQFTDRKEVTTMCGRSYFSPRDKILSSIRIEHIGKQALDMSESAQLLPGRKVPTIVSTEKYGITLTSSYWGYGEVYNARAETIELVALWSKDYFTHRAVFPLDSFYEGKWFASEDEDPLWAAAIYREAMRDKRRTIESSMITVEAKDIIRNYHHRMPALINTKDIDAWLNFEIGVQEAANNNDQKIRLA